MKELEQKINDESSGNKIELEGKIVSSINQRGALTIGKQCVKGLIQINRPNIIIDGSKAEIEITLENTTTCDLSLFYVHPLARNVEFKNIKAKVYINNPIHSNRLFSLIYNVAHGLKIINCKLEVYASKQLNIAVVYNNGNLDTHMETRADNLVIDNSFIKTECKSNKYINDCIVYGVCNYLANSISVQNTFIYAKNHGNGSRQKAVGIYTNGRFGRFVGNNIKANGSHNKGREKEQAHAYGFINEGLYSIISSNNIVGEWAGMCVGLENKGEYSVISNNKILATHTICGRAIKNTGANTHIESNIITSTSRNARLIEHNARNCIISQNIMDVLMPTTESVSGCGIYAVGQNCEGNIISENIIKNICDCGVFTSENVGLVKDNLLFSWTKAVLSDTVKNIKLLEKLDEKNIKSII